MQTEKHLFRSAHEDTVEIYGVGGQGNLQWCGCVGVLVVGCIGGVCVLVRGIGYSYRCVRKMCKYVDMGYSCVSIGRYYTIGQGGHLRHAYIR